MQEGLQLRNTNENRLIVHVNSEPIYDIVLTETFEGLSKELIALGCEKKKLCIVTDSNVAPLYLDEIRNLVQGCCRQVTTYIIPAGEENKNLDTVRGVYEHLIQYKYDRKDYLIALGGGVVGDLCGFTAATYLRGIGFIQIPTTLLSQVDSSIGGKTGVDFDAYKNMVGAFHMPKLVYTNVSVLKTLPFEQYSNGMGEVIKHGLIRDKEYYEWILDNKEAILKRDPQICRTLVYGSNLIKREVVEIDPTEQNERATLNFGHTLGHAVEKLMNLSILHGHCVALGALAALKICEECIENQGLDMRLIEAEYTLDRSKIMFVYVADDRVDFRELLKELATKFKCRIELRQIGPRNKAKIVGGLGSCGMETCCSRFLNDFDVVSINMAKNQLLALNVQKLSGQCGKLMCCLKYEDDQYKEMRQGLPKLNSQIEYKGHRYRVTSLNVLLKQAKIENKEEMLSGYYY